MEWWWDEDVANGRKEAERGNLGVNRCFKVENMFSSITSSSFSVAPAKREWPWEELFVCVSGIV